MSNYEKAMVKMERYERREGLLITLEGMVFTLQEGLQTFAPCHFVPISQLLRRLEFERSLHENLSRQFVSISFAAAPTDVV